MKQDNHDPLSVGSVVEIHQLIYPGQDRWSRGIVVSQDGYVAEVSWSPGDPDRCSVYVRRDHMGVTWR